MKSLVRLLFVCVLVLACSQGAVAQNSASSSTANSSAASRKAILDRLVANMVPVAGGTFTMGATSEQGDDVFNDEKPAHRVTVSSFSIGRYEVTQEEWQAVMGSNPSYFKGKRRPVEQVSWEDCQKFITRLNRLTGRRFRLPTEAEWEYAARGGNRSRGYKYSGSSDIASVAWCTDNSGGSTHVVGQKRPNELGLYDMTGNVFEWCSDWYGSYSSSQTNPGGPSSGFARVLRGGSWDDSARGCRVSIRGQGQPSTCFNGVGLRLVLATSRGAVAQNSASSSTSSSSAASRKAILDRLVANMVPVAGGTFTMGATSEQGDDAWDEEKPAHRVTVSSFSIGRYEVTQEEWQAVMGSNPSKFKGKRRPVECVSWEDCQQFITRLNQLTGRRFRLPTEAEWEYAARGGNRSQGYKYSGSSDITSVAWYDGNSGNTTHEVGQKRPNELGLYDMAGNVWEWCSDWYGGYSSSSQTNPGGPSSGSFRMGRGGSWYNNARNCRVSCRSRNSPGSRYSNLGLRLAL